MKASPSIGNSPAAPDRRPVYSSRVPGGTISSTRLGSPSRGGSAVMPPTGLIARVISFFLASAACSISPMSLPSVMPAPPLAFAQSQRFEPDRRRVRISKSLNRSIISAREYHRMWGTPKHSSSMVPRNRSV